MDKKQNKLLSYLDKRFKVSERASTFKSELIGGAVNFLVLVYVMVVIPNILTGSINTPEFWNAIYLATLLSIIATTFVMAIGANLPLVTAPGIGLSSYFATLMLNGTYTFPQVLTIALIAGVLFMLLTLLGFRKALINGLPNVLKVAIPAGIGLFILNIGLNSNNSGILDFLINGPTYMVNGSMVIYSAAVAIFGFIVIATLNHYKVKGSIFIGILAGTGLHFVLQAVQGINPFVSLVGASWWPQFGDLFSQTFFKFDFYGAFISDPNNIIGSILMAVLIVFSYILVDLFDTVGTLFAATKGTTLVNKEGQIINLNRAFWADSSSTVFGACIGVPGCTVYVESVAGIKSGARTGISSLVVVLLFTASLFLSPLFMLIPAAATAPALIFVGVSMFNSVLEINFNNATETITGIFAIILMPLTGNISYGIGAGLILYCILMLLTGKGKKVNLITYILAFIFVLFFATQNLF